MLTQGLLLLSFALATVTLVLLARERIDGLPQGPGARRADRRPGDLLDRRQPAVPGLLRRLDRAVGSARRLPPRRPRDPRSGRRQHRPHGLAPGTLLGADLGGDPRQHGRQRRPRAGDQRGQLRAGQPGRHPLRDLGASARAGDPVPDPPGGDPPRRRRPPGDRPAGLGRARARAPLRSRVHDDRPGRRAARRGDDRPGRAPHRAGIPRQPAPARGPPARCPHRRPHRTRQPAQADGGPRSDDGGGEGREAAQPGPLRPRRLQALQRHLRPSGRGHPSAPARHQPQGDRLPARSCLPDRWR